MSKNDRHTNEKLLHAYNQMMIRVSETLSKASDAAEPALRQAVAAAEEKAIELGELSREEAIKIGEFLRRDMQDAGKYLASNETQELKDWLLLDLELIENQLLEMLFSVADQARLDMLEFEEELAEASQYRTGEITGPGTLVCMTCDEPLNFHATGHIPPCPHCHDTYFIRPENQ